MSSSLLGMFLGVKLLSDRVLLFSKLDIPVSTPSTDESLGDLHCCQHSVLLHNILCESEEAQWSWMEGETETISKLLRVLQGSSDSRGGGLVSW